MSMLERKSTSISILDEPKFVQTEIVTSMKESSQPVITKVIGVRRRASNPDVKEALVLRKCDSPSSAKWVLQDSVPAQLLEHYTADRDRTVAATPSSPKKVKKTTESKRTPTSDSDEDKKQSLPLHLRFRYGDSTCFLEHSPDRGQFLKASRHLQPGACVDPDLFLELCQPYIDWRSSRPALIDIQGVGRSRATSVHFSSASAETMCRTNLRFILGILRLLGYPSTQLSLHMLAVEQVMREIQSVLEGRAILAGRKYQLYTEMRTILWWLADQLKEPGTTAAAFLNNPVTVFPSYHYLDGLRLYANKERKDQERVSLQKDTEDLEHGGKWLSDDLRQILTDRIKTYFTSNDRLNGGTSKGKKPTITPQLAMEFQAHLLLHLLNDNVIPVPRSEIFCKLQLGVTFDWDVKQKQYVIEFRGEYAEQTKVRQPIRILIPHSSTPYFKAWLRWYRPILVALPAQLAQRRRKKNKEDTDQHILAEDGREWTHNYLFVKKDGTGPRTEIANATVGLQKLYLDGKSVTPHQFRGMQATDGVNVGISDQESRAMCAGRQHTQQAASRYYVKVNRERNAMLAAEHLAKVRSVKASSSSSSSSSGVNTTPSGIAFDGDDTQDIDSDTEIGINIDKEEPGDSLRFMQTEKHRRKKQKESTKKKRKSQGISSTSVEPSTKRKKSSQHDERTKDLSTKLAEIDYGE